MTSKLHARGPDDEGTWSDPEGKVFLGHRRLSIIDVSAAGHQPMLSSSGRFVITFNGEIYNHLQIRVELGEAQAEPVNGEVILTQRLYWLLSSSGALN